MSIHNRIVDIRRGAESRKDFGSLLPDYSRTGFGLGENLAKTLRKII
jgi:hypothetical protein